MERSVGGDDLFQRLPAYELHDDEGCAVVLAHVVDVDDVRVRERGGGARLAFEAGAEAGVGGELRSWRFDRHVAAEEEIVTEVDDRHPALAEATADAIATSYQCLRLNHHASVCRPVVFGIRKDRLAPKAILRPRGVIRSPHRRIFGVPRTPVMSLVRDPSFLRMTRPITLGRTIPVWTVQDRGGRWSGDEDPGAVADSLPERAAICSA